jgi:hypothetical protein
MAGATAPAIFLGLGLRLQATGNAEGEPPSAFRGYRPRGAACLRLEPRGQSRKPHWVSLGRYLADPYV